VHPKCLYERYLIIGKVNDIKLKKIVNWYFYKFAWAAASRAIGTLNGEQET
jgi:hypothetical protein